IRHLGWNKPGKVTSVRARVTHAQGLHIPRSEIDAVRELLRSKPRPAGFAERRERLDAIGSTAPLTRDISLEPIDANGVPAEWSLAAGSDAPRVLLFLHGGGYCSGSIVSHRGMGTEAGRAAGARTRAGAHPPPARPPLPPGRARPMAFSSIWGSLPPR